MDAGAEYGCGSKHAPEACVRCGKSWERTVHSRGGWCATCTNANEDRCRLKLDVVDDNNDEDGGDEEHKDDALGHFYSCGSKHAPKACVRCGRS